MKDAPKTGRWIVVGVAVLLVLIPVGVYVGVLAPRDARREELGRRLDRSLQDYAGQRWERPVLRGEARAGNAWTAQEEAIGPLASIPSDLFDQFAAQLERGTPPTDAQRAQIVRHTAALDRYRASVQRSYAFGRYPFDDAASAPMPSYLPHLRASRLLLARAIEAPPDECLRVVADVVRLGQDRVAGMGLVPLMVVAVHARDVVPLAARCIGAADAATLEEAERELAILARHSAPTGSALEHETLMVASMCRQEARRMSGFPFESGSLETLFTGGELLEGWDLLMGNPADRRSFGDDYPADIDRMDQWVRDLEARPNEIIQTALPDATRLLRRDATGRAAVRMLWAAVRLRRTMTAPTDAVPALLDDPELRDPTTGRPFDWRREGNAAILAVGAPDGGPLEARIVWPEG